MITRYAFGEMVIDGVCYQRDLIALPDGTIHSPWWRAAGHVVALSDIDLAVTANPEVLVIGTGYSGCMQPDSGLAAAVAARGIELILLPTTQATERFNELCTGDRRCAGCFHLTC